MIKPHMNILGLLRRGVALQKVNIISVHSVFLLQVKEIGDIFM